MEGGESPPRGPLDDRVAALADHQLEAFLSGGFSQQPATTSSTINTTITTTSTTQIAGGADESRPRVAQAHGTAK